MQQLCDESTLLQCTVQMLCSQRWLVFSHSNTIWLAISGNRITSLPSTSQLMHRGVESIFMTKLSQVYG